jgi:Flp pilus assembly protein CpaB
VENLLPKGMLGTPRRTVVAGVAALVLATVLLLVYLNHYRSSVKSASANITVLRAKVFIPKGTTALDLARRGLVEVTAVPKEQLKDGAITDAAVLHNQVALDDVYPGQQLTIADFGVTAISTALSGSADLLGTGKATGTWRALAVNLDATSGITPQTQTGDHVDVYVEIGSTVALMMQNVLVLQAPNQVAAGTAAPTSGNYILRIPAKKAPNWVYAAQNGSIRFTLRPQKSAKPAGSGSVTSGNVLGGL